MPLAGLTTGNIPRYQGGLSALTVGGAVSMSAQLRSVPGGSITRATFHSQTYGRKPFSPSRDVVGGPWLKVVDRRDQRRGRRPPRSGGFVGIGRGGVIAEEAAVQIIEDKE